MINPYQHALDTRRIALNDTGLLAWVKHNEKAILQALQKCADSSKPVPPIHEIELDI